MSMPSRREFVGSSLFGALFSPHGRLAPPTPGRSALHVVCVGAHPDDPETGCGGTLARAAAAGHRVTIVYLTRGERGIEGASLEAAAATRTREAEDACRILGATAVFAGQVDGDTEVTRARVEQFTALVRRLAPDLLLTHWALDTHLDHQAASVLSFRAWLALAERVPLGCFEVNAGDQTRQFAPTDYVDITPVVDVKRRAVLAHASQDGAAILREHHEPMAAFRGREVGVTAAEAFVRLAASPQGIVRL